MHEHPQDDPELLSEIEKLGYDPRDIKVDKSIAFHAVYMYIGCGISALIAWGVMWWIDDTQVTVPEASAWERDRMPEQPNPLLQSNKTAHTDIENLRKLEKAKTDYATWIDEDAGVARIPVDAAIAIMLEEGFDESAVNVVPVVIVDPETTPTSLFLPGDLESAEADEE